MKRTLIVLLSLALASACATTSRPVGATETLIEREKRLTLAVAQGKRALVSELLADDFRCAVAGSRWFTFDREYNGWLACTGVGHERTRLASYPRWLRNTSPRWATIDDIEVKVDGQQATVVTMQTYNNWFPYSRFEPVRSRVTDTWLLREGEWKLHRRLSEPLPPGDFVAQQ